MVLPGHPVRGCVTGVSGVGPTVGHMFIDCGTCRVRGDACTDCVVTFLTIPVREGVDPPRAAVQGEVDLDEAERGALDVLARSGLVPPLRMVRAG